MMTSKPFGVNLTILPALIPADYDAYAQVIADEKVTMVEVAGGSPKKYIKLWHDAGVKVLHKSATIRHALKVPLSFSLFHSHAPPLVRLLSTNIRRPCPCDDPG